MNKYINYTWLKYLNSTNKFYEFIWHCLFIIFKYITNNRGDINEKENAN